MWCRARTGNGPNRDGATDRVSCPPAAPRLDAAGLVSVRRGWGYGFVVDADRGVRSLLHLSARVRGLHQLLPLGDPREESPGRGTCNYTKCSARPDLPHRAQEHRSSTRWSSSRSRWRSGSGWRSSSTRRSAAATSSAPRSTSRRSRRRSRSRRSRSTSSTPNGLFNHIIGGNTVWFGDPSTALWSIVGLNAWTTSGTVMLFYLAALQSIPNDVYEAAAVDGAGAVADVLEDHFPAAPARALLRASSSSASAR